MALSPDTAGGFLVPLTLDQSINLTSDGSFNPLRQISRVVQAAADSWAGVSSAGVTAEWLAEAAEAADAAPTVAQLSIPVHKGSGFVPFSFEIGMDAASFLTELRGLFVDAADQLMSEAFTTGSGSGQPTGVITALPAGSIVTEATHETFTSADVYATRNALPPRFQGNSRWCAALSTINTVSAFKSAAGARLFPEVADNRLLRRPLHELSNMAGSDGIDPGANADNKILLVGDFRNFVIVDWIGPRWRSCRIFSARTIGRRASEAP